jgi:superfamily II DNA/RNA helicase
MSQSFHELGVSAPVVRALAATGITHPFAIQHLVLPDALAGLDILAESPTGSGKTLAFGLPLVERTAGAGTRPAALVLVPTRELALQVAADLTPLARAKGVSVATVYGGAPNGGQIKKARSAHVLVATPGRLFDLLERRAVSLSDVRVLVLDEADRMLDMGFKPQVDRILRSVPANRQTMLFSATLDGGVAELARAYTVTPTHVRAELPAEAQRGEVEHTFVAVTSEDKLERLVEQLGAERGLALVFVRTKHGADKLARKLERQHDIRAVAMHGNLSQSQRERALAQFESGRVSTLQASIVTKGENHAAVLCRSYRTSDSRGARGRSRGGGLHDDLVPDCVRRAVRRTARRWCAGNEVPRAVLFVRTRCCQRCQGHRRHSAHRCGT